ncbi:amino acid adenylation domain-containing protein [Streptomyces sp. NPDC053048]|uniref:amino acid adenylation domain-containing protein n=1 Tax=Streptomyces sp. NPDC053048 TaxID=3365694 RepID=UPI0037D6E441
MAVLEMVRGQGERHPGAVAVAWDGEAVTYGELMRQASATAASLRAAGAGEGTAVAVRMPAGARRIAALLGVFEAGAHLLWLGPQTAGDRTRQVLADLRPGCLVTDGPPARDGLTRWYCDELGGHVLDGAAEELTAGPGNVPPARAEHWAYVAYTSGSSGTPKAIPQTHGALAQFVTWMAREFGIGPGSRVAQWVTPEHDPALCETFAALVAGATLCPVPDAVRVHPERLAGWLARERITHLQTVPGFARELLAAFDRERPTALSHLLLMGEALPDRLANELRATLPGTRLFNLYGPTETIAATWYEITTPMSGTVPIGRPIPGREVSVLDEADHPCPPGVTGEIVIRSPYVTPLLPELYRTGDLGLRRADGLLEFRGRKDFQIKLYGHRLELTDIEAALAGHDSVEECAVRVLTGRDGLVDRLVVYVVPRRAADGEPVATAQAWRAHLRGRFGTLVLPATFETLDGRLPRNAAGKVDRSRLR